MPAVADEVPPAPGICFDALAGDKKASALLVVDMQNDFLLPGAPVRADGGMNLVPVIAALARDCRQLGLPVIFTQEMHRADESDFGIELAFEPVHCLEGSGGEDIVNGLKPEPGDFCVRNKRRYDAFLGTDLDTLLRVHKIENLIVTGVCTDVCVISTVQHARNLDFRCFVASDAVAGTSRERHEAALLCMSLVFAHVGTTSGIRDGFAITRADR